MRKIHFRRHGCRNQIGHLYGEGTFREFPTTPHSYEGMVKDTKVRDDVKNTFNNRPLPQKEVNFDFQLCLDMWYGRASP